MSIDNIFKSDINKIGVQKLFLYAHATVLLGDLTMWDKLREYWQENKFLFALVLLVFLMPFVPMLFGALFELLKK